MSRDPSAIASDPEISAWVSANAGAGKTYTLASRVARLLLAGASPAKILCLTFTKAAAAEMQDRLFRQLGEWAMLDDTALTAAITGIGGDAHTDLRTARQLFATALEAPGRLKVLTLHAFCQIVLTRFPLEAGVPPAFDVLDEQSADEMIAHARQRVLERAGAGDPLLADAVTQLAVEAGEFRMTQILDAALGGDRRRLDRLLAGEDNLVALARRAHGAGETDEHDIATDFCSTVAHDITILKDAQSWLAAGTTNDVKLANFIAKALAATDEGAQFAAFRDVFIDSKDNPRPKLATKKLADAQPGLLEWLVRLQTQYCEAEEQRRAARGARLTAASLTLIAAVRHAYENAKILAGVLDYDDLITRTESLLSRGNAAAWVLYKLDGGIDHVLIDEAQDTSPAQWNIVRHLTGEFFAGAGRSDTTLRTIFAVGDEKQSIFSFQGADPSQFETNRMWFEDRLLGAGQRLLNQPLITSRRSVPQLLQFVDKVFEPEAARAGLTFSGAQIRHEAHRATARGGIAFWPALLPLEKEETDPWAPVDSPPKDNPFTRLARQVADRIAGWIASGARLPGHDRPITPGDIMILLPRREPFGSEVIRQLKQRGIPVAGADRIHLRTQIGVMDLIALGRFAIQQEDDLTLATLLRSPLCGLSEGALEQLAAQRGSTGLWRALTARQGEAAYAQAHHFLFQMLERADYAPPFEFYSHALTALGGQQKLLARLGNEAADAIAEFMSLTLTHEENHAPSLEGFLDWVSRGEAQIKRDMERGRDEVRVMTVHGAKGLEADIVILPDTTSQPGGHGRHEGLLFTEDGALFPLPQKEASQALRDAKAAADAEALKEHRRLLYVALTRARDQLHVCGFAGTRGPHADSWYELAKAAATSLGVPVTEDAMPQDGDPILVHGTLEMETGERVAASMAAPALPGWMHTPAPDEPASPRLIRPSDAVDATPATSSPGGSTDPYLRGKVIHALLAGLPELPRTAWGTKAKAHAKARGIPDSDVDALVTEAVAVLEHPDFANAFGPDSRAEAGLVAELPELGEGARVNGRVDRLAVSDDEILILDFKTNRPPPRLEAQVAPVYLGQMALYRAAAAKVFPGRRIVCGLLFTDGPRLMRLSDAILDRQWADLADSLLKNGA